VDSNFRREDRDGEVRAVVWECWPGVCNFREGLDTYTQCGTAFDHQSPTRPKPLTPKSVITQAEAKKQGAESGMTRVSDR